MPSWYGVLAVANSAFLVAVLAVVNHFKETIHEVFDTFFSSSHDSNSTGPKIHGPKHFYVELYSFEAIFWKIVEFFKII